MTPMQALQLISDNIKNLNGTRQQHEILVRAEGVLRELVLNSGNVKPVEQIQKSPVVDLKQ